MGFGPNPADVRAAEVAAQEARDRLTSKPLTPFETELLAVLGEIRDALNAAGNSAGAVTGPGDGGETADKMWRAAALLAEVNHVYGEDVHFSWSVFELRLTAQLLEHAHATRRKPNARKRKTS